MFTRRKLILSAVTVAVGAMTSRLFIENKSKLKSVLLKNNSGYPFLLLPSANAESWTLLEIDLLTNQSVEHSIFLRSSRNGDRYHDIIWSPNNNEILYIIPWGELPIVIFDMKSKKVIDLVYPPQDFYYSGHAYINSDESEIWISSTKYEANSLVKSYILVKDLEKLKETKDTISLSGHYPHDLTEFNGKIVVLCSGEKGTEIRQDCSLVAIDPILKKETKNQLLYKKGFGVFGHIAKTEDSLFFSGGILKKEKVNLGDKMEHLNASILKFDGEVAIPFFVDNNHFGGYFSISIDRDLIGLTSLREHKGFILNMDNKKIIEVPAINWGGVSSYKGNFYFQSDKKICIYDGIHYKEIKVEKLNSINPHSKIYFAPT